MEENLEIGGLYEYTSQHRTAIWLDGSNTTELNSLGTGDLFVLLEYSNRTEKEKNFLICKGLFVKTGLIGGFVCYRSELQLKVE